MTNRRATIAPLIQPTSLTQPTSLPQAASVTGQRGFLILSFLFIVLVVVALVIATWYALRQDRLITEKFEGKRWNLPAKVYSRPLELSQGATVTDKQLQLWLTLLNYRQSDNYQNTGTFIKTSVTDKTDGSQVSEYYINTREFAFAKDNTEPTQVLKVTLKADQIDKLQSTHPNPAGIARLEPILIGGIYPDNNEDRIVLTINQMPQPLINALIATEDRGFYEHHGISLRGIARALYSNFTGKPRQGGSTITQQLVKNFYLNSDKTFKRKANEALMSVLLELHYSKSEILQTYMNEINLGQNGNHSINGFGLAAQFYFDRPLNELRLDQLALLVGLAKGPTQYNPLRYPEAALARRNTVLDNMLITGKIDQATHERAVQQPLDVVKNPTIGKSRFPAYLDVVKRELNRSYRPEDLKNEGLKIFTSFDPSAQQAADDAVAQSLATLKKSNPKQLGNLQAALVSADPRTGELLAVVGGNTEFTGFNRAVDAKRQVGSLLKPIIYLSAFEQGRYNLASRVSDAPIKLRLSDGGTWSPSNYGGGSHGDVPLLTALADSYNQAAVRVGMEVGVPTVLGQLAKMGITTPLPNYPAVLLGAVNLSPMDMLGVYQVLATGGFKHDIHTIRSIVDSQGRVIQGSSLQNRQVVPIAPAYMTNFAMQHIVQTGTAKAALSLGDNLNLAGKTGTTNDYRDAWFAGYSGNYVNVVWVGRDDNQPTGLSGGNGALPMWINYMQHLPLLPVNLTQPGTIEWLWLENGDGTLSNEKCPRAIHVPVNIDDIPQDSSECAIRLYELEQEARFNAQRVEDAAALYQNQQQRLNNIEQNPTTNRPTTARAPSDEPSSTDYRQPADNSQPLNPETRPQSWLEKTTKEIF